MTRRTLATTGLLIGMLMPGRTAGSSETGTPPKWTATADRDITWFRVARPGIVVVGTDAGLFGLGLADGDVRWRKDGLGKSKGRFFASLGSTRIALADLRPDGGARRPALSAVDVTTGDVVWTSDPAGLDEGDDCLIVPDRDQVLIAGRTPNAKRTDLVSALEMTTGRLLWTSRELPQSTGPSGRGWRSRPPLFDSDDTAIFMSVDAVQKFDLGSGQKVWSAGPLAPVYRKSGNHAPLRFTGEATRGVVGTVPMTADSRGDRVYVAWANTLAPVAMANGKWHWEAPPMLPGIATQIAQTGKGILVGVLEASGDFEAPVDQTPVDALKDMASLKKTKADSPSVTGHLVMLDPDTGAIRWDASGPRRGSFLKKVANQWGQTTNFALKGETAAVAEGTTLHFLDLGSGGEVKTIALSFRDDSPAIAVEARPEGYLVVGLQEIVLVDPTGKTLFHTYHRAPSLRDLKRGTAFLEGTFATLTLLSGDPDSILRLDTAHRHTIEAAETMYILTRVGPGHDGPLGLVKTRKSDGANLGEIALGTEAPIYSVAPGGWIVFEPDARRLQGFRLGEAAAAR
jgi:outer membrane protein assembly factor BamB